VEWVLNHCTYDFKDLTTVFIQGSVFILTGIVIVPPLFSYCAWSLVSYGWLFAIPVLVLYRARSMYFDMSATTPLWDLSGRYGPQSTKREAVAAQYAWVALLTPKARERRIRLCGVVEVLKCICLKASVTLLILWMIQASFFLTVIWRAPGGYLVDFTRYWTPVERLLWDEILLSPAAFHAKIAANDGLFWHIAVVSQLLL
jgi:hypothetical protein